MTEISHEKVVDRITLQPNVSLLIFVMIILKHYFDNSYSDQVS